MTARATPLEKRFVTTIADLQRRLSNVEALATNPVAIGGTLARTSLTSPNYVPGTSGWSMNSDGTGDLTKDVTITGANGTKVTIGPTQPTSPSGGDFWFDTSSGNPVMKVYNAGTASWTLYQWGTSSINNNAITQALLSNGSVGAAQLIAGAVGSTAIAGGAVGAAQIANGAVGLTQLSGSVTARALGGITTTISGTAPSGAVANDIWINSASGNQLEQYNGTSWVPITFTATNVLAAQTITGNLIAAGTIVGSNIAAGTITANNIAANTITANLIAAGAITGNLIAAGTITSNNIAAGTISANLLVAGIVVAGIVDSTTISTATLTSATINSASINGGTITGASLIADGSSGEFLVYSSTPATGNLVGSWSAVSGTDGHSNSFPAGLAIFNSSTAYTTLTASTFGNLLLGTGSGGGGGLEMIGQSGTPSSSNSILYSSVGSGAAAWRNGSGGWSGQLVNAATGISAAGSSSSSYTIISASRTVPANDSVANTVYRITCYGYGTYTSGNVGWQVFVNGAGQATASTTGLPGTFVWESSAEVSIRSSGSAGTATVKNRIMISETAMPLTGGSSNANPNVIIGTTGGATISTITYNTTVAVTLALAVACTGTAQVTCVSTVIERIGP